MKVLVFGGTGFLGSHLCEYLLKKKHEVGLYRRESSVHTANIANLLEQVQDIHGEFSQEEHFDDIVAGYDCVYHLISATVPSKNDPMTDIDAAIKPTLRLLDACVKHGVQKVVFFSSGGTVYGIPRSIPIKENHPTDPISAYGIHKLALEKYIEYYHRMFGLDYTILRISNPYGERQRAFSSQGLIANILGRYLSGEPVDIWGDGSVTRDYIYVRDMVDAAERVMRYTGEEKIFNVGSGRGYSVKEILSIVEDVVDSKIRVRNLPGRKQDVPINVLDVSRIRSELGWIPQTSLEMGIPRMISSWNADTKAFDLATGGF